jgi:hypothetical protein
MSSTDSSSPADRPRTRLRVTGRPPRYHFAGGRPPVRAALSAIRRGLDAQVVHDGGVSYVLIRGIRSERTLTRVTRAVALWRAFGRYRHVLIDLSDFRDWSPQVLEVLSDTVRAAAATDLWMGFFPLDSTQHNSTELNRIHVYPDRALALRQLINTGGETPSSSTPDRTQTTSIGRT